MEGAGGKNTSGVGDEGGGLDWFCYSAYTPHDKNTHEHRSRTRQVCGRKGCSKEVEEVRFKEIKKEERKEGRR